MNELLNLAVKAHGGLERWSKVKSIRLAASITGAIWFVKGKGDALKNIVMTVDTKAEQLVTDFPGQDKRSIFEPRRVVIETAGGTLLESRDDPEESFKGQQQETPWDDVHVAYFCGEALWTYLNTPFLYTHEGFQTEEIPSIQIDGETCRRLKVIFPDNVKSHTREQISCFGPDGLLRRHDYTVDILGGATGLNYASEYRDVDGIIVPTKRRIYAYKGDYQLVKEPLLVSIDMGEITLNGTDTVPATRERLDMLTEVLFSSLRLGALQLPNRIVMAPLTRMRAGPANVPTALNAEYSAQRSSAGLIISEGTAISPQAQGFPNAPGIYTAAQIAGWRTVTNAVHARGGRIIMQIAHNGRNSHSSLVPDGRSPVAPSAIPPTIPALTKDFQQVQAEMPRSLQTTEIAAIVGTFRQAARNAIEAGFDGVELQGANSHLIEQFLEDGTNQRTDGYGGSKENRARFLLEIVAEVVSAIGADRLGVRLSPFGQYGGIHDTDPLDLFSFVIGELNKRRIAYLHLIEARGSEMGLTDELHENARNNAALFRTAFDGPLLSAAAYTPESAAEAVDKKHADAVAFGRLFIANPDLVERIKTNQPLNPPDRSTFYGGGAHGYTDYQARRAAA